MLASIDFELMRRQMILGQFEPQGIVHKRIVSAFQKVPREFFLEKSQQPLGYTDQDIRSAFDKRSLLAPIKLGKIFNFIDHDKPSTKILIIGSADGYSLALAYEMGMRVYGVESNNLFFSSAQESLQRYFDYFYGITNFDDLLFLENDEFSNGLTEHAAFDYILIEGGVEYIPSQLLSQLRPHGKLIGIYLKNDQEDFPSGVFSCTKDGRKQHAFFETATPLIEISEKRKFIL